MTLKLASAVAAVALLGIQSISSAAVLLDFGPTAVSGTDRTVSPAHAAGALTAADVFWNQVGPPNQCKTT